MTKKTFSAQQWFQKEEHSQPENATAFNQISKIDDCPKRGRFPTFTFLKDKRVRIPLQGDSFSPLHCFTPGWRGDSLHSKNGMRFNQLMLAVEKDVRNELMKTKDFPKSIKMGLYSEFLSYAESLGLHFEGLDDLTSFWGILDPLILAEDPRLSTFIDIYVGRVTTITVLKLRFISSLLESCGLEMNDKALFYPTSFLSQIFKKGSQTELKSRALESNLYSWYRPHEGMREVMRDLLLISREISITEITKTVSAKTQVQTDQTKLYSHALSHVSMGLFLNSLQVNLPMWIETVEGQSIPHGTMEQERIISCKYFGDYQESLSLSHWLAQENNKNFKWDEILCPDFKGLEFVSGTFTKICNELQFLTFLAQKSEVQGEAPISYICRIMGEHFRNRKNSHQRSGLLIEDSPFYTSTYDRVVLNLCHFPKNNPQHFLISQILDQVNYLKSGGYLFVLSSKKLFVPSLRERLNPILKELKTEAIFDLEEVKGKGELGSYVYVFRKIERDSEVSQLCSYFRVRAHLANFQQFASITDHLRSFYLSHLDEAPSMARLDFPDGFEIEYFQEAVVNGLLIHSATEDQSRITHPTYFKSLLENCVPLETLFEIRALSPSEKQNSQDSLNIRLSRDLAYFLVVDLRTGTPNLELHPMETFRGVYSDYGQIHCSYFQLIPKISNLNPNILRNYFKTTVGQQVTHLTFSGGHAMVKGSLSKFLVPKFFTETESLPDHLKSGLDSLTISESELLESSPQTILKAFTHIDQITRELFPRYACEILSRFSQLEQTLEGIIWKLEDGRMGQVVSFNNPLIHAKLVQKPTQPLYPSNNDIYFEIVGGHSPNELHRPLTELQIQISHEGDLKLYSLELISNQETVVRLHAEEPLIAFVHYILSEGLNHPISKLIRAVHVPALSDLKEVIENTESFKTVYKELLMLVQKSMMDAFRLHMTPKRKP